MKLIINYDLIKKVNDANCVFSLEKYSKRTLICTAISTTISLTYSQPEEMPQKICLFLLLHSISGLSTELVLSTPRRIDAIQTLKRLSFLLKQININTNYELLLNSYKYKTIYENASDSESFKINQKKYIMIPVIINGEEKEISIVQDHIIGSKEYILSQGEPQKIYRLALNPI